MTLKINRWPARLDLIQSISGLFLAVFMWAHMLFVSSILLGKDAMYFVSRLFEGEPIFGKPYPLLVSFFAQVILTIVAIHALTALRKFPSNYKQYHIFHRHIHHLKHNDTLFWYIQVITGFLLFFLVSIHLYQLITHPQDIGPYASSDRVWSGLLWPLYLILLFVVEVHAGIGLYRLSVKWGWFCGNNTKQSRQKLKLFKWILTSFFIVLGLLTLAAYMKIGYEHEDNHGERFIPSSSLFEPMLIKPLMKPC